MRHVLFLVLLGAACAASQPVGFRVEGRHLVDRCGQKVVLRGVNEMTTWINRSGSTLEEIAKTGANCARIVALTTDKAADLETWISLSLRNGMIPMPELHDATGEWAKLGQLFDYWARPDILAVVKKYEASLLLNVGNEVGDNSVTAEMWKAGYAAGIKRLRSAGVKSCIVVDAPGYGQKIDVIRAAGLDLLAEDPDRNLLFSAHAYWPSMWGWSDQKVKDELKATVDKGVPFIIGEFGNAWEQTAQGAIPYKLILEECQRQGIGWLAWSWGPGNNPQTWLNMTRDGTHATLQSWGLEVAETLPTSIKNTSVRPASLAGGACIGNGVAAAPRKALGPRETRMLAGNGLRFRGVVPGAEGWRDAGGRRLR